MLFWTKDEYQKFSDVMMDKPLSYYAFEMLHWCGIREGNCWPSLLGTSTLSGVRFPSRNPISGLKGRDVITDPKTPKSNRVIKMPNFLCEEMQDFIKSLYGAEPTDRIFGDEIPSAPGDGQGRKGNRAEAYQNP